MPVRPAGAARSHRASWLEVSAPALRRNVAMFRAVVGTSAQLGVVVKGNGYGHGLAPVVETVHASVDVLYVIAPGDALALRELEQRHGWDRRRIVVLGTVDAAEAAAMARASVDVALGDEGWRGIVHELRGEEGLPPLRVHVHVDTGLSREGVVPSRVADRFGFLAECRDVLDVVGVMSHFANTEDVTEQAYAHEQLSRFDEGLAAVSGLLGRPTSAFERHFAASAAAIVLPESRLDVVRIGIGLYGLWPSSETRLSARVVLGKVPVLEPVLTWRCRSQLVKTIEPGSFIGYGCTLRCRDRTQIAVLPVGYFDGYPRLLSNQAHVIVQGRRCPVMGRVMMNHLIVDVTGVAVDDGGEVVATLLGTDGHEQVSAGDLAGWAQTIHYEIVARLGSHLERRVVEDADESSEP